MGENEIYRWESIFRPFLVHNLLGPRPPLPPPLKLLCVPPAFRSLKDGEDPAIELLEELRGLLADSQLEKSTHIYMPGDIRDQIVVCGPAIVHSVVLAVTVQCLRAYQGHSLQLHEEVTQKAAAWPVAVPGASLSSSSLAEGDVRVTSMADRAAAKRRCACF